MCPSATQRVEDGSQGAAVRRQAEQDTHMCRSPRPNFDHVYFAVDDLDGVYRRAQATGGLSSATGDGELPMGGIARRPWGERSFYMSDPFGNPLCFVDSASVFSGRGAPPSS